jgi:hypothetical protein
VDSTRPDRDTPKALELDDAFEEQKNQVDAWEQDMRQERKESSS